MTFWEGSKSSTVGDSREDRAGRRVLARDIELMSVYAEGGWS